MPSRRTRGLSKASLTRHRRLSSASARTRVRRRQRPRRSRSFRTRSNRRRQRHCCNAAEAGAWALANARTSRKRASSADFCSTTKAALGEHHYHYGRVIATPHKQEPVRGRRRLPLRPVESLAGDRSSSAQQAGKRPSLPLLHSVAERRLLLLATSTSRVVVRGSSVPWAAGSASAFRGYESRARGCSLSSDAGVCSTTSGTLASVAEQKREVSIGCHRCERAASSLGCRRISATAKCLGRWRRLCGGSSCGLLVAMMDVVGRNGTACIHLEKGWR